MNKETTNLEFIEKEIKFLEDMINMDLALMEDEEDLEEIANKQKMLSHFQQIKTDLEKLKQLENIFSDCHICEIKARFNELKEKCDACDCDNCPLSIGDDICLKIIFENKWKFQEERDELKLENEVLKQSLKESVDEKNEIINKEKTPTKEEIIKEWEALGYKWKEDEIFITLIKQKYGKSIKINKKLKDYKCYDLLMTPTLLHTNNIALFITFQEHQLLTKTFKMLGWE